MRTCFSLSSLACASLIALACTTQAQAATVTVSPYYGTLVDGTEYQLDARTAGVLQFGEEALGAMDIYRAQVLPEGTGTVSITNAPVDFLPSISVKLPVTSVTGQSMPLGGTTYFGGADVRYGGGFSIQMGSGRNVATRGGGSITLSNLHVDPIGQRVLADVTGGNNVGSISQAAVWSFTPISYGNSEVAPTCNAYGHCQATVSVNNVIGSLTLTPQGFDLFTRSLNLTNFGKSVLYSVQDFGTITTSVPEPSSGMLAVLGMLGVGLMKRRRTATTH